MLKKIVLGVLVVTFGLVVFATPTSKDLKFEKVTEYPNYKLEVAPSTRGSMKDQDGDTLVGARIRLTPVVPIEMDGKKVAFFINFVVAVCGHDGIILARSEMFAADGTPIRTVESREVLLADVARTPTTEIYNYLCKGIAPPAAPTRRDTGRNNSLWT